MYSRMEKYHGRKAQRFSIRKYSFGAASVLLGTALLLGANAVKADETNTSSTKATEVTNSDKQKPNSALTTPVVEELPELKIDDEQPASSSQPETADKAAEKTDKKSEIVVKEKTAKEQADKKEVDKEKTAKVETEKPQDEVKTVLTQLTSEAEVMASVASNFSDKEVKDEAAKKELTVSIEAVKLEAAKSNDLIASDASKDQMVAQVNRISAAIEAVYTEMKRAGHAGKVEARLADAATQDKKITGKDVLKDGETVKAVTNAYVDINADNTKPTGWGFDTVIQTSTLKAGGVTKIELTNLAELGSGLAVGTAIKASDGVTVGVVKSIDFKSSTGNNNNKSVPYWAQRTQRGMTYDQRVAEQPPVANETGTYTYNIEWKPEVKNYPNVSFGASNLSGDGYLAPEISQDTPYTATIKIDGRTVLEHTYTRKGQKANYQKQGTSVSLSENNGLKYLNNEQISRSDSIVLKTDSDIRYGVGSKFTIKLPNADFTEFKELSGSDKFVNGLNPASTINPNKGDSITYRPASRWANVKTNENNVWILNDGRESGFTLTPKLISPTELELTVTEGTIQEGSVVSMPLQSLGIEKVIKDKTLTSEYSKITYKDGFIKEGYVGNDKTAATFTVSGGESVNGEKEDVTTTVPNGWSIVGDGKIQGEPPTGTVVITLKDITTGEVIGRQTTKYTGNSPLSEDGIRDTTNVLGNKYDVSNEPIELTKEVNGEEYVLVNLPGEGVTGTLSVTKTRARDLYTPEELAANKLNESAFVNPVEYNYVKKTKVEEVKRTIKYVYADDVKDLAGQQVFESTAQTVSYIGTVKKNAEGKAEVDSNYKPIYVNWVGNGDTNLPEVTVPQKEGYIASVEKVPAQATTATDDDYEVIVTYTPIQKAKTTFVYQDKDGNVKEVEGNTPVTETGKGGDKLTKADEIAAKIKEAQNKGYELVSNTYPEGGKFDKDKDTDQEFKVTLKERVVPVTPNQPKTPGTPVDPNNPDGPKYPAGLEEKDLNKTVTRTITYVYEDGTPVLNEDGTPKVVTQEAKFTREAKVNLVTGEVTYGDWSEAKDLSEVTSPVVKGFVADKSSVAVVNVTGDSEDIKEVVTYKPLGSWVPNIPGQPTDPIKYPNDPTDPTKPGQPTEVVPYVPGYTPKDKDGNPLKPVDPNDPTKGYEVPSVPTNPGEDTPINYVANKANLVVKYVDEKGKDLLPAETTEGKVGDEYATSGKVIKGYVLVRVDGEAKGKIGKDGSTVTYVYKPLGSWVPNIPGQPTDPIKYPNDPTDPTKPGNDKPVLPYVPGYTPKDKDGNPLKSVDPNDPTKGYEVPNVPTNPGEDTPINYVKDTQKAKTAFVDEKGNPIPGVDAITEEGDSDTPLTKEAEVKAKIKELENKGYELVSNTYPEGGKFDKDKDTDQEFTVTLKERVVPVTPDQPKTPGTPVDPNKPNGPKYPAGLEEKDLNKTVTRTITYVYADGTPVLNEDGTPKVVTQEAKFTREVKVNLVTGEVTYGDWSEAKDLSEVTSPVVKGFLADKATVATVKVDNSSENITEVVTYKPIGSWIPNIPGQPTTPIKYPNDPTDPTKPGKDKPVLPYVPGYTPKDKDGNPLKPVDPNNPTKGYEVPNVPTNPGEDTPINYVPNPKEVEKHVKPGQPSKQETPKYVEGQKELPNTGTEANASLAALGLLGALGGFGLLSRKKKED